MKYKKRKKNYVVVICNFTAEEVWKCTVARRQILLWMGRTNRSAKNKSRRHYKDVLKDKLRS